MKNKLNRKELYWHLVITKCIYLPNYQLDKAMQMIENRGRKSFKDALYEIEDNESLQKYNDPRKGTFMTAEVSEKHFSTVRKEVILIDEDGTETQFDSIYQAAQAINKPKGFGNISRAIKYESSAYGYKWKFK